MKFVVLLQVFCFLPLPIHTKLPVHINGHFALDHEARRGLWRDDDGLCFCFTFSHYCVTQNTVMIYL